MVLFVAGCTQKKIEITTHYIINPHWSNHSNSIRIDRMVVKHDSVLDPFADLSQDEILSKLKEDSLFRYFANIAIKPSENYGSKRIYFDKDNGFTWLNDITHIREKVPGKLEGKTWYKFSNLFTNPFYIYIYVDSLNTEHRFDINLANY